ncbi:MaoC family dehydratase [Enterovirga rhinocerotis]|uniref:L-erythro-3-methylmalyl-CoA dehydratase n=1 Tax=Enterovirga rhinocerotis TaxID=1339210 RepID=A0A4R7C0R7_9HYPH|nr:MaoC family dehydratase [Enterovirga rhinocerotis]TDR90087.1 L-erythro-3-methylmalyl-CoA dehydratase [Enterovirga rhinocerotis]
MKTNPGNFFEDFRLGQEIRHATPRTITAGDVSLATAIYGSRFALQSADSFARAAGYPASPVDDILLFNIVFGKTVPDVSLNAVANLGYAGARFLRPVYPGDTVSAVSEVIGLKANASGKTGIVYVRTQGTNDRGEAVLDYNRWVMVQKRDPAAPNPPEHVPELPKAVAPALLGEGCPELDPTGWDDGLAGSAHRFGDYAAGERIDHVDGATIEEAEHQLATRLYQNTAKVHFDAHAAKDTRFGKRLIYGGHIIATARALSFNGLGNACRVAAINGGRHVSPSFAGDTIYAWSEILETAELPGRADLGALRVRTIATKNQPCGDCPGREGDGYHPAVVLELDYWVLMIR